MFLADNIDTMDKAKKENDGKFDMPSPHNWQYRICAGGLVLFGKNYFKTDISGLENLPSQGPGIIVANHQSYLDILIISMALERKNLLFRTYWIIGKSTFQNPFLHWLFSWAPLIVVNGTVRRAESALKAGNFVTIFPEGIYTWDKVDYDRGLLKIEPKRKIGSSAAILGLKTGLPIIPIGIQGTRECMPPYAVLPKKGNLSLVIGKPFQFEVPEPEDVTDEMISEKSNLVIRQIDALR